MRVCKLPRSSILPSCLAGCLVVVCCLAHGETPLVDEANPITQLFKGERLDLWSLRPVVRPDVPSTESELHSIDAFVRARLAQEGLAPSPEADARQLARRVWLDLTGLPPTPEEMSAYLADTSPDRYERLVDRLLASRAFAEHWARMWLDVVRYADSAGYDWDEYRPEAYRYRDYVIDSLHNDKPFDRFVREQLAGDELAGEIEDEEDQEQLVATGFLRIGPYDYSSKLFKEEGQNRANVLADMTETTAAAFLGLTMGCCRCHDHKTEPLSHEDHYRLRAFFAGVGIDNDVELDPPGLVAEVQAHNKRIDGQMRRRREKLKKIESDSPEHAELTREIEELAGQKRDWQGALAVREMSLEPPETFVLELGLDASPVGEAIAPGIPSLFDPTPAMVTSTEHSSGRRMVLADWIISPDNPLTSRVIVNRLWQGMFGTGIVATPNDFGYSGTRPVNQPLLDWLAADLVDHGWSLKHTIRQIALSHTYRQTAYPAEEQLLAGNARDSLNTLLWRANPRRLRGEVIRDSMLQVAGLLNSREGGPAIWPELSAEAMAANPTLLDKGEFDKGKGWYTSPPGSDHVRSIYLVQKRSVRLPLLEAFDPPDTYVTCGRRESSITAPQALTLLNSTVTDEIVAAFSNRVEKQSQETESDPLQVAVGLALQREPSDEELSILRSLHDEAGLAAVCRVLLNTSEFLTTD